MRGQKSRKVAFKLLIAINFGLSAFIYAYQRGPSLKLVVLDASIIFSLVMLYSRRKAQLSVAPGSRLRHFAEFCFSKKTFTEALEPALCDMQKEHFEALAAGRLWQARMVLARGYWSFWSAVVAQLPISFARRAYEVWKASNTGS